MNKLEIIISSDINNIMMVERFIDGFSERFHVPDYLSARVNLSVIEAVNNAILSGNKRDLNKNVTLIASIENNRLMKVMVLILKIYPILHFRIIWESQQDADYI